MNESMIGPLTAFLSSCTWAIGTIAYSRLTDEYAPARVNLSRALVALPLFIITALLFSPLSITALTTPEALRATLWCAVSVIASYALGDVFFLLSAQSLGVPGALAIASSYPILSALSGVALRGETLGPQRLCGVTIVVTGTVCVILADAKRSRTTSTFRSAKVGVLLALGTCVLWSLNSVAVGEAGRLLPAAWVNTERMFMALFACPFFAVLLRPLMGTTTGVTPVPWKAFKRNIWIFALEGFGGAFLYTYGLSHSPLAIAAVLSALAPVLAMPVAIWSGRERLSILKAIGVVTVVIGLILL